MEYRPDDFIFAIKRGHNSSNCCTADEAEVETASVNITSDVTELVAKSENKVVTVTARARGQALDTGSGAVYKVDGKTVYIITNNHVVRMGMKRLSPLRTARNRRWISSERTS